MVKINYVFVVANAWPKLDFIVVEIFLQKGTTNASLSLKNSSFLHFKRKYHQLSINAAQ